MRFQFRASSFAAFVAIVLMPGCVGAASTSSRPAGPQPNLVAGEEALNAQRYTDAVRELERAIVADPKNAKGYLLLGQSHRHLGNHQTALKYFRITLELDPTSRRAMAGRGQAQLGADEVSEAEETLRKLGEACEYKCAEYMALERALIDHKIEKGG